MIIQPTHGALIPAPNLVPGRCTARGRSAFGLSHPTAVASLS